MPHSDLLDLRDYPCIEATGLGDFYGLTNNRIRFLLFDWFRNTEGVWYRRIVGQVTRSADGLCDDSRRVLREQLAGTRFLEGRNGVAQH